MAMSDNNLNKQNCCACGVPFGLDKDVEKAWRESKHNFFCPNGHALMFKDPSVQEKLDKEIAELKEKVSQLEAKLESEKKRADELQAELDIWKPNERK